MFILFYLMIAVGVFFALLERADTAPQAIASVLLAIGWPAIIAFFIARALQND